MTTLDCPANPDDLCAVVVTYHPDAQFHDRLERLSAQVGHVVIVDNTPDSGSSQESVQFGQHSKITLVRNGENLGVATALNRGVTEARARGFSWLVTFDQDSTVERGLIDNLIRVWGDAVRSGFGPIGVLGTNHVDLNSGKLYVEPPAGTDPGFIERATVVTSGSLLSAAAYDAIGPFRDDFFIDSVDQEYCLRARKKGFRVLLATAPLLIHEMGKRRATRLPFGHEVHTVNYPPFRWYFIVKNLLTLADEYALAEPTWTAARIAGLSKRLLLTLSLEGNRVDKARCMGLGALDFARRRKTRTPRDI